MRLLFWGKDGGAESTVWGFWPVEIKSLFSVALLVFEDGSREAYHTHAFNSVSWVLRGRLTEYIIKSQETNLYNPSFKPIITKRDTFHKVRSIGRTYVLTFRGPWSDTWQEYRQRENKHVTLTHGRVEIPS